MPITTTTPRLDVSNPLVSSFLPLVTAGAAGAVAGAARSADLRNYHATALAAATAAAAAPARPGADLDELNRIAAMRDPVLRNYRITQSYADLSNRMARMFGNGQANWCTFAAWASRQAGQTIRQEDGGMGMRVLRGTLDATVFGPNPVRLLANNASAAVARGNQRVFAEIAPEFARFLNTFENDTAPNPEKLRQYLASFRPGGPERGGQDLLKEAFTSYYQARFETDPKKRSELMMLGNVLIGVHEQTRLQPDIEAALPRGTRHLSTSWMMNLRTPRENLSLGSDVPRRRDGQMSPPHLRNIDNPRLRELLARYDRTPNTLRGSGASDWTSLDQRMNYIVDLFRSRQDDASLFGRPLTADEERRVRRAGYSRVGID